MALMAAAEIESGIRTSYARTEEKRRRRKRSRDLSLCHQQQ
jgi:hypothetical protein